MPWEPAHGEPTVQGWGPATEFHAPQISGLVASILQNRLAQQENVQKQFSDLAKQIQTQRENTAFGQQAQNAGLLPGVDTSNLSAAQSLALAKAIQEQTPDTDLDAMHKAAAARDQAMADWIGKNKPLAGPDTGDTDTQSLTRTNPTTGALEYGTVSARGVVNWRPYPVGMQPSNVRTLPVTQTPEYQLRKNFNLDPEELYQWSPEYGTATADAQGKVDPTTFTPTKAGGAAQPFVRVTKAEGGQVVMPRQAYEMYKGSVTPQEYLGDPNNTAPLPQGGASPSPGAPAPQTVTPQEPQKPVTGGEKIDPATAQQYLVKAQGNRAVAQRMAQSDGWTW